MPTLRRLGVILAIVTVALTACGSDGSGADGGTADENTASEGWTELAAPTSGGGQLDFGDLQGSDVMLWFWAPW